MVRGFSSVGRAPALQAGGQRFEPVKLHHFFEFSRDEDKIFRYRKVTDGGFAAVL